MFITILVSNPPSLKKSSSSTSHPLSQSQKGIPQKNHTPAHTLSKKPSPPKPLLTNLLAHKPKKSSRDETTPLDSGNSVLPPTVPSKQPPPPSSKPRTPSANYTYTSKQPNASNPTPLNSARPAASATENSVADATKDKIDTPTPYPALPILHKEVQRPEYSMSES